LFIIILRSKFHERSVDELKIEKIMEIFEADLRKRKRLVIPKNELDPIDLWTIVIKEYLKYPKNDKNQISSSFGINYCLFPNIMPYWFNKYILESILSYKC
jgi:hypothetical protein